MEIQISRSRWSHHGQPLQKTRPGNTFLVYRGGEFKNFELKFEYKIVGGNSGVQYRSFEPDPEKQKWVVGGYRPTWRRAIPFRNPLWRTFRYARQSRAENGAHQKDGKFRQSELAL